MLKHAPQRQRRYLTRRNLCTRYGWKTTISVDRAWKNGRLPPPTTFQGKHPLWEEEALNDFDDRVQESSLTPEFKAAAKRRMQELHDDGTLRKARRRAAKAKAHK
jgi:hypothetical protein